MIIDKDFAKTCSEGVFPPIFHKFRDHGIYCLRFQKNFEWIYVVVDERIPCHKGTKNPVFGHCKSENEIWVQMIEKAYAKLHGCYANLISGYIDEGIQELTGMPPVKILIKDETSKLFPHKQVRDLANFMKKNPNDVVKPEDALFNLMEDSVDDGCLLGCSIKGYGKKGELLVDDWETGLILDHAYSIQDVIWDEHVKDLVTGERLKLLRLRNPWGGTEWKGAWSDDSKEMKDHRKMI